jgi:glycosyltransferase involved in cell wall biosynthesis
LLLEEASSWMQGLAGLDAATQSLVSVIIPCRNGAAFIREAIDSVLRQTFPRIEAVVVDDASTDESWEIIGGYGDDLISVRNDRQRGAGYSRNLGRSLASGEFLMFLDADDYIEPDTIGALVTAISEKEASIATAEWRFLMNTAAKGWVAADSGFSREPPQGDLVRGWLTGWYIPPCAMLWRGSEFDAIGGWDESLAANQDGDLVLRALLAGQRVARARGGLGLYRKQPGSESPISNSGTREAVTSRLRVFMTVEEKLESAGLLDSYRFELGRSYYSLARLAYLVDVKTGDESERRAWKLAGRRAASGTLSHRLGASLLGLRRKERFAKFVRAGIRGLRSSVGWRREHSTEH